MGSLKAIWQKRYGNAWEEHWNAWRAKISASTSSEKNPMYGRHDHVHGLQRYARERVGKTLEEVHGEELASELRASRSLHAQGTNNPAFGKVYANGGKSVKGYYKGFFFRSLLEYSFMKHLEQRGLSLQDDVEYERFVVPYMLNGRPRTYRIDFFVKPDNTVYEVKPAYVLKRSTTQEPKWDAARELLLQSGIQFRVVTELDFPKIAFDVARLDSNVVWKEETFKYFRSTNVSR